MQGAAAAIGVGGAAAFAASETVFKHEPNATARKPGSGSLSPSPPTSLTPPARAATIDLGAAKYAAKGDGSDDTAALRAWRADILAALDGGATGVHALVPCGTFALGEPLPLDVLGDNVHLQGAGRGASVLTQLPKVNSDILQTRDYAGGQTASGFSLTDLTVDANGARQTQAVWCAAVRGYNYDIESVDLVGGGAGALSSEWHDTTGTVKYMEARIRGLGCREYLGLPGSSATPTYGILWAGPHDSQFSDVILSTLAAAQPGSGPSYGFVQAHGASGEYITNMHVWGRHHYGVWADPKAYGIHLANVVAEGAFLANAVVSSATTWSGGEVYGTLGNGGTQPRETGISLGIASGAPHAPALAGTTDGFGCAGTMIQAVRAYNFSAPGACIDFTASGGGNVVSVVCAPGGDDPGAALYRGSPSAGDEVLLLATTSADNLIRHAR